MKSENLIKLTALALLLAGSASAQEAATLDVQTTVQKEQVSTNDDGDAVTELVDAETVVPGEKVIYTTSFRNTGSDPAENIVITNPISENLVYVEGSAFGPGMDLEFSADGGEYFAPADALTVTDENGERPARPDDYTHIRWSMAGDLASGAQGVVRFSAILK